jgi:hypothetical protein
MQKKGNSLKRGNMDILRMPHHPSYDGIKLTRDKQAYHDMEIHEDVLGETIISKNPQQQHN